MSSIEWESMAAIPPCYEDEMEDQGTIWERSFVSAACEGADLGLLPDLF